MPSAAAMSVSGESSVRGCRLNVAHCSRVAKAVATAPCQEQLDGSYAKSSVTDPGPSLRPGRIDSGCALDPYSSRPPEVQKSALPPAVPRLRAQASPRWQGRSLAELDLDAKRPAPSHRFSLFRYSVSLCLGL